MSTLTDAETAGQPALRPFLLVSAGLILTLAIAGFILARYFGIAASVAVPVVAAFCFQVALYCAAVSSAVRPLVQRTLRPWRLAAALVPVSVAPYLIYAIPTGVVSFGSTLKLLALCSIVAFTYPAFPVRRRGIAWQDVLVASALAYPMISGLSSLFRDIYQGFDPPAHRLDSLGKLMLIPLGLYAFLTLRRLQGTGFRLVPVRQDWEIGFRNTTYALPWLALVGLSTGFLQWDPPLEAPLARLGAAAAKLVGIYFTTALAEEFLMRGVVQNLTSVSTRRPLLAQGLSAVLFGAVHLGRGGFPNIPHAATATVLGWFCGRAYTQAGSVTAAMIAHALAVAGQELFFR